MRLQLLLLLLLLLWCSCVRVSVLQSKPLNVEYLMMDASVLLPPTGTPLTGIDFVKRLPCGDVEKTRRVRARTHTHMHRTLETLIYGSRDSGEFISS